MKHISPLTDTDLGAAYQIETASHYYPWSRRIFQQNQGKNYLNFKIAVQQQLVGFIITQHVTDEATLFNLAIAPSFQRQGFATCLLSHVLEIYRHQQIHTMWLEVRESNMQAIQLYHSFGFNEITIRTDYYPVQHGRENALIMALTLS